MDLSGQASQARFGPYVEALVEVIGHADDFDESLDIGRKTRLAQLPERSISTTLCRSTNHQITRSASKANPIKFHDSVEFRRLKPEALGCDSRCGRGAWPRRERCRGATESPARSETKITSLPPTVLPHAPRRRQCKRQARLAPCRHACPIARNPGDRPSFGAARIR